MLPQSWAGRWVSARTLVGEVLLVVDDAVTVGEGPALDVLPRDAHVIALEKQSAPCKLLGEGPVDLLATLNHSGALPGESSTIIDRRRVSHGSRGEWRDDRQEASATAAEERAVSS